MTLKHRGIAYAELRDFPKAIADHTAVVRLVTEAIQLVPESPVNDHRRGVCWFHMSEYRKAYDDLTVAIGKEPDTGRSL